MLCWVIAANTQAQNNLIDQKYITNRFVDATGQVIEEISVPGIPPENFRMPVAVPTKSAVLLTNVPAFSWSFGCSATAAAMQASFYDRTGYYNMYAGPTHGGIMPMDNSSWGDVTINGQVRHQCPLSATRDGVDGRSGRGHVDDYWILYGSTANDPYITNGWTQHTWGQCTGDYMGTNQTAYGNSDGNTTFYYYDNGAIVCDYVAPAGHKDGCYGLRKFYESRGYTVLSNCNQKIYGYNGNTQGFTFAQYKSEIDAGRPVLIQVEGHTMLGYGYDNTGSVVYLHDTWDYNNHTMTWGGYYGDMVHYGVTTIQLQDYTPNPCSNIISLGGGGTANSKTYWGGGEGVWFTSTSNPCNYTTPGIEQIYSFVAPVTGIYTIGVTTATGYVDYLWKTSSCSSSGWNCIDDINSPGTYGLMSWVAGTTYYILLDDEDSDEAEHTFYVFLNPCQNMTTIGGTGSGYTQNYSGGGYGAWYTTTLSPCGFTCEGREKIYSFEPSASGYYSVVVTAASGYVDYMWKSSSCSSSGWQCIDDIAYTGTYGSMLLTAGNIYYILLDDENTTAGAHSFYLSLTGSVGNWLGAVNNDWYNGANWNGTFVPDATTNVTINPGYTYYPIIASSTANCNDISIGSGAQLKVGGGSLNVSGNMSITGLLSMDNAAGVITVLGDVSWQSGSTANFTANAVFWVHGHWNFNVGANANIANGNIDFTGSGDSWIRSYSASCAFPNLGIYKTGANTAKVSFLSTAPLTINGNLNLQTSSNFEIQSDYDVILKGSFNNYGNYDFTGSDNTGTFVFDGSVQSINHYSVGTGIFNNVRFSPSSTVYAYSDLTIAKNLTIDQGVLNPGATTLSVGGNWSNTVGTAGFTESTSRVIFNGGNYHQYCSNEFFNTLELDKASGGSLRMNGANVTCAAYDWTAGAVDVLSGSFTANDLIDNGIYGAFYNNTGGTINLTNSGTISWVDLNGDLHIFGGNVNIYGNMSDWTYGGDASIEMSGGTLDFHTCGITLFNGGNTFSENITGGTIRTAYGFVSNRAEFTPSGGTFECYGPSDAIISLIAGSSLYDVNINKTAKDAPLAVPSLQGPGERSDKTLGKGAKANSISLNSNCIFNNLTIDAGTFNLGGHQLDVANYVTIYGELVMEQATDVMDAYRVTWESGSTDNVNNGEFHAGHWHFNDGTHAILEPPNTVYCSYGIDVLDADAAFGNLVLVDAFKAKIETKTIQPLRVDGYFTVESGATWQTIADVYVNGICDVQNGASFSLNASNTMYLNAPFTLNGLLDIGAGNVLCHGEFAIAPTGSLIINGGSFITDSPRHPDKGWEYLSGNFSMTAGLFEITHNSIHFGSTATTSVSGGTLKTGGAFYAGYAGTFEPTGGTVEVSGSEADVYIYCGNGNYFHNLLINRASGVSSELFNYPILVQNDLTIQSGALISNNYMISVGGDWNNLVGTAGFDEGTGTVQFFGTTASDILSPETFYNLSLNKTYASFDGLEVMQNVTISNNLNLIDGTMKLRSPANLYISGILDIDLNAGLNASDGYGPQIHVGGNWDNANTSYSSTNGFHPGDYSVVTFNGTTDQLLTTASAVEYFNSLTVDKSSGKFRPNDNIQCNGNILINNGIWEDNLTGLTHVVYKNFTVSPTGALYNVFPRNTIKFKGSQSSILTYSSGTGYFYNLYIEKSPGYTVTQVGNTSCQFDGNLTVQQGGYNLNGYYLSVFGNTDIMNLGTLLLPPASLFIMSDGKSLNVNSGGALQINGTLGNPVTVRANLTTSRFNFNVNSGGTIAADYCVFKNNTANGVYVKSGATIDAAHAFTGCTFQDGATGGALLTIDNNQTLALGNAIFPANTWGGTYNVAKTINQGQLNFVDYTGDFSGENYDNDAFNRINWGPVVPENLSVTGTIPSGTNNCYNALNTITVAGGGSSFVVENGGSATLIAGSKVSILYGAHVEAGGYLHAYITTTSDWCSSLPPAMVATVTGEAEMAELPVPSRFNIFPNPTNGKFTLVQKGDDPNGAVRVNIFGMYGELLQTETIINERSHEFNVSNLMSGMYFVKVEKNGQMELFKLILTK